MESSFSIRAYSKQRQGHAHDYHQMVLPIQGAIEIELTGYSGRVSVGECVVIRAGTFHHFHADEAARFIVVDTPTLPEKFTTPEFVQFSITPPLMSFLYFIEKQLEFQVDSQLEQSIFALFFTLLSQQDGEVLLSPRMRATRAYIVENLDTELTIEALASIAFQSPTQFKKHFKAALGISPFQFITGQRMEKAKALLTHTDLPVQIVAERVGYQDLSAFSRRFSSHFGMSPRQFIGNQKAAD